MYIGLADFAKQKVQFKKEKNSLTCPQVCWYLAPEVKTPETCIVIATEGKCPDRIPWLTTL